MKIRQRPILNKVKKEIAILENFLFWDKHRGLNINIDSSNPNSPFNKPRHLNIVTGVKPNIVILAFPCKTKLHHGRSTDTVVPW